MVLPDDPLADGILAFAKRLRNGQTTALATTEAYLARIEAVNSQLRAFCHVAHDTACSTASAVDKLIAAGVDLGPLMGVPVAIKDNIAVRGMPTRAGSELFLTELIGDEGPFILALRRAGCVILGKAQTVEFAIGAAGPNYNMGTPRNPWDTRDFRLPSGSSGGSAVAIAAGLCGFAVGTDTGGSVRGPASFCGVFGLKSTQGTWSLDGILPMSRTLDSLGPLTRTAADAAVVWATLTNSDVPRSRDIAGLRIGIARDYLWENIDDTVATTMNSALLTLERAGARIVEINSPELRESDHIFQCISRSELLSMIGRERFEADRSKMNPDVADRISTALTVETETYIRAYWRMQELSRIGRQLFDEVDVIAGPTKRACAPVFADRFISLEEDRRLAVLCAGPTRSANVLGLCASSQPIQQCGPSSLPIGLQLLGPGAGEGGLLSIAMAVENMLPPAPRVNLHSWCK